MLFFVIDESLDSNNEPPPPGLEPEPELENLPPPVNEEMTEPEPEPEPETGQAETAGDDDDDDDDDDVIMTSSTTHEVSPYSLMYVVVHLIGKCTFKPTKTTPTSFNKGNLHSSCYSSNSTFRLTRGLSCDIVIIIINAVDM